MAKNPLEAGGWILTHLVAASIGGAVWFALKPGNDAAGGQASAAGKKESFRTGERRERPVRGTDGDKLLGEITGHLSAPAEVPPNFDYATYLRDMAQRTIAQADALPPAADVPAAAKAVIELIESRTASGSFQLTPEESREWSNAHARVLHWMRQDPDAAFKYLATTTRPGGNFSAAVAAAVIEKGPLEASRWIGLSNRNDPFLQEAIAAEAARQADPSQLSEIKTHFSPGAWNTLLARLPNSWPQDKPDEMFDFAVSQNSSKVLMGYLSKQGLKGYEWLSAKLDSDEMDPAFKAAILKDPGYRSLFANNPEIPFEERINVLAGFAKDKSVDEVKLDVGAKDVTAFLNKGRDWRYAFHTGSATMEEVFNAAASAMPDLAKQSPEAIRNQLYKELAEDNGDAALRSLEGMPPDAKWEMALKPARWMYHGVNPQKFYDYLQNIPVEATETSWQTRLESWDAHAAGNHRKLDSEYADWVLNLPEGPDREMASYTLLKQIRDKNSATAVSLRSEIKDQRLVDRLNKKP